MPDNIFKIFSRLFFQINNFFFQTRGYQIGQWSIETKQSHHSQRSLDLSLVPRIFKKMTRILCFFLRDLQSQDETRKLKTLMVPAAPKKSTRNRKRKEWTVFFFETVIKHDTWGLWGTRHVSTDTWPRNSMVTAFSSRACSTGILRVIFFYHRNSTSVDENSTERFNVRNLSLILVDSNSYQRLQ